MGIPRKRCPSCGATFEGAGVSTLYSCDVCGNGYLSKMADAPERQHETDLPLPRSGGEGNVTHTRDNF